MNRPVMNRTYAFAPTGPYSAYLPQFYYNTTYVPPEKSVREKVTYYFLRALAVIRGIIRLLQSSSPFFEQYSPVLKQLPNMYKMLKLIQDVNEESEEQSELTNDVKKDTLRSTIPSPKLFI